MKKIKFIVLNVFFLMMSFSLLSQTQKTNSIRAYSQSELATMYEQTKKDMTSELENVAFRFETAFEEQDIENTNILQNELVKVMSTSIQKNRDYLARMAVANSITNPLDLSPIESTIEKQEILLEKFQSFQFDFERKESKADIKHKAMPSQFIKLIRK